VHTVAEEEQAYQRVPSVPLVPSDLKVPSTLENQVLLEFLMDPWAP